MPTTHAVRDAHLGIIALIACALLWSLNGPMIKLLSTPGGERAAVSGITIACYRSLFGGALFIPAALRRIRTLRATTPAWVIGSVATFTLMTACFVIATTQTAAASAIILQYTSPLFVFALSPILLRERPRVDEGLVLLLSMVGVAVIFLGHERGALGPLFIALLSGVGYGALTVTLRGLRPVDPSVVVALNFLGSGLVCLALMPLMGGARLAVTPGQFGVLALMGVVQFALPYRLFSWALQRVEAHRAALIVLIEAVLNPIWTYLLVGEPVPAPTLWGGPLILLSVVGWMLVTWRRDALQRRTA